MRKKLYIFSGLGADKRVFQKLDFSGFSVTFIKWITPEQNESLESYASRLLKQIQTDRPILIGISFGGLVAVEVAKQIETEKILVINSAKTKHEIPQYFRLIGQVGLNKVIPIRFLKSVNFLTYWFFGVRSLTDKQILKQILKDTDPIFLKWAIDKILKWSNISQNGKIFHIHGTSDRILPLYFVDSDWEIENGGHLMSLTKAKELNEIMRKKIND